MNKCHPRDNSLIYTMLSYGICGLQLTTPSHTYVYVKLTNRWCFQSKYYTTHKHRENITMLMIIVLIQYKRSLRCLAKHLASINTIGLVEELQQNANSFDSSGYWCNNSICTGTKLQLLLQLLSSSIMWPL